MAKNDIYFNIFITLEETCLYRCFLDGKKEGAR